MCRVEAVQASFDELGRHLADVTFCVVDLETTGGSAEGGSMITEIGAVKVRGGEVLGEFQTLVNPRTDIPAFIAVLTGITPEMRAYGEELFGPVAVVYSVADDDQALQLANDTVYGLGAGVWSRDMNTAYRAGRAIEAGRVWTNCYHAYPAHAAFGGYKKSGIGRENHRMMLDHYQQTKNLLVSYSPDKLGFF